jgi:hypothetical protein
VTYVLAPGFLGVAGPSIEDWKYRYWGDDRWSLPPEVLDPRPNTAAHDPGPDGPNPNKKHHPFASPFSFDFDEVDLP